MYRSDIIQIACDSCRPDQKFSEKERCVNQPEYVLFNKFNNSAEAEDNRGERQRAIETREGTADCVSGETRVFHFFSSSEWSGDYYTCKKC